MLPSNIQRPADRSRAQNRTRVWNVCVLPPCKPMNMLLQSVENTDRKMEKEELHRCHGEVRLRHASAPLRPRAATGAVLHVCSLREGSGTWNLLAWATATTGSGSVGPHWFQSHTSWLKLGAGPAATVGEVPAGGRAPKGRVENAQPEPGEHTVTRPDDATPWPRLPGALVCGPFRGRVRRVRSGSCCCRAQATAAH